jgi:sortase A
VLIATGLLIFGFVAYQLWGTGIQYAQAQNDLEREFEAMLRQSTSTPATSDVPGTTSPTTAPTTASTSVDDTETGSSTTEPNDASDVTPPATTPPTDSATATVDPALAPIELGGPLGTIEIPRIGMSGVMVAGVRVNDLKKGVGHFPDTPVPGQQGNSAIAGHRTTYGAPFYRIDELEPGDEVRVTTLQGSFVYLVTGTSIVEPFEYQVVADQPDKVMLTLTSCDPRFSAKRRIVVTAELDVPGSDEVRDPVINYGKGVDLPTGDEQVTPDDEPTDGSTPVEVGADRPTVSSADAFEQGWFSDDAAFGQVALWGLACMAVALAATFLGRRTRNWVGAVVGITPFVLVLYFWFENVNRLLPPNL